MTLESILNTVLKAYSGTQAKADVARLYRYSRHITNAQYEASAAWCCERMRTLGFDNVELLKFPSDGKILYGNWKTSPCWNVDEAWLKLKLNGRWQSVANHVRIPTSVFPYSAPTNEEVRTQLVYAKDRDVTGKLVFSETLHEKPAVLARHGALGVATDFSPNWPGVRGPRNFQDGHRWENAYLLEDRAGLAGFSLSRRQGKAIRRELDRHGAVECRYLIRGTRGPGHLHCATGCLRGVEKPDEEVVIVAHLYEPGANDNCSGVAGAIEALRAIKALIDRGVLSPPERTIRVVFTFEIVGFLAYFQHARAQGKTYVAGVNPDMIGQDQKKCRSVLHVYHTPDAVSSFTDPLLMRFVGKAARGKLKFKPKTFIVNDNIVSDPAIGAPCPALIHLRDRFYHSNEDTPDKVSARTLKLVGGAMAAYVYVAAAMNPNLARETARLCVSAATRRLKLEAKGDRDRLGHLLECELTRLNGLEQLTGTCLAGAQEQVRAVARQIKTKKAASSERVSRALAQRARTLIPVRTVAGTCALGHLSPEQRAKAPFNPTWSPKLNLPVFWSDGRRSLWDIHQRQRHESPKPLSLKQLVDYFVFLDRHKLIRLRKRRNVATS